MFFGFRTRRQSTRQSVARSCGLAVSGGCDKLMRMEDRDIDALFLLSLSEFTGARNALAARLKKAGQGSEAERVKALGKPPVSAWAVNQLYWKHREAFDRLDQAGARFRQAQAEQLAGRNPDVHAPRESRRQALADLTRLAATVLRDGGHNPAPDTLRRITATLEAISAYAAMPDGPRAGRLTHDIDPPGFDALASLMPLERESGPRTPAISAGDRDVRKSLFFAPRVEKSVPSAGRADRYNLLAAARPPNGATSGRPAGHPPTGRCQ